MKVSNNFSGLIRALALTTVLLAAASCREKAPAGSSNMEALKARLAKYYALTGEERFDEAALYVLPVKRDEWINTMNALSQQIKSESIEVTGIKIADGGTEATLTIRFVLVAFREGKPVGKEVKEGVQKWTKSGGEWFFMPQEKTSTLGK